MARLLQIFSQVTLCLHDQERKIPICLHISQRNFFPQPRLEIVLISTVAITGYLFPCNFSSKCRKYDNIVDSNAIYSNLYSICIGYS